MTRSRPPADTVCLLGAAVIAGAAITIAGVLPFGIQGAVPYPIGRAWTAIFTAAGATALAGAYWPTPIRGWLIETWGRTALAATAAAYAAAYINAAHSTEFALTIATTTAITASSTWRVAQIRRTLRALRPPRTQAHG
jgi:hypothetical protein